MADDWRPMQKPKLAARILLTLIRAYQSLLSPLLLPRCRFYPSCSHYTIQAIERFGAVAGGWLAIKRLVRCHPGCRGGIDEIPERPSPSHQAAGSSAVSANSENKVQQPI